MQRIICMKCGEPRYLPDVIRCPFCNKYLMDATNEFVKKHVRVCATSVSPRRYSDRRPGRPTNDERDEFIRSNI